MNKGAVLKTLKENEYSFLFKEEGEGQEFEITSEKIDEIGKIKELNIGSGLTSRRY